MKKRSLYKVFCLLLALCLLAGCAPKVETPDTAPTQLEEAPASALATSDPLALNEDFLLGAWLGQESGDDCLVLVLEPGGSCRLIATHAPNRGDALDGWRTGAWEASTRAQGGYTVLASEIYFSWDRENDADLVEPVTILDERTMRLTHTDLDREIEYTRIDARGVINAPVIASASGEEAAQGEGSETSAAQDEGAAPADSAAGAELFGSGEGTAQSPYLIETAEHLNNVRLHLDAYYLQTADIRLSGEHVPIGIVTRNGTEWEMSGAFEGVYDGGGFSITGMEISKPTEAGAAGLFAAVSDGGVVKNLHVEGLIQFYEGPEQIMAGGIAGINNGLIENCHSSVTLDVDGTVVTVGGIAGANIVEIIDCSFEGLIESAGKTNDVSGGIVGLNQPNAVIRDCTHTGDVTAHYAAGGIAGWNDGAIENCDGSEGGVFSYKDNAGEIFALGEGTYADVS